MASYAWRATARTPARHVVLAHLHLEPSHPTDVASSCQAVEHGDGALTMTATGTQSTFVDGGSEKLSRVMHTVELSKLSPGVKYNYRVGDPATADGGSKVFAFTAKRSPAQIASVGRTGVRILAYCDMGHRESSGVLAGP